MSLSHHIRTISALVLCGALALPGFAQTTQKSSSYAQGPAQYDDQAQSAGIEVEPGGPPRTRALSIEPEPDYNPFEVDVWTSKQTYYYGENVRIYFRASRDSYVYVFNTTADGETRQIYPNYYDRDNWVEADYTYGIPDSSYRLVARAPAGRETITVVAVRERFRDFNKYRDYTKSSPFPKSLGPRTLTRRVSPEGGKGRKYAESSTSIRVRAPYRR